LSETTFASSSGDNTVKISDIDGQVLRTFSEHTNWVWKVIKLTANLIATSSEDKSIKIWNIKSEKSICTIFENYPIISMAFNNETQHFVSGNLNGNITVRTLSDDLQLVETASFKAHNGIIRTIKFINDTHFATGGEDNKIKIWNLYGECIAELEHQNFVQSIELLDDKTLISASYDGTIKTWTV
jgi:WD40 repeat protein